MIRLDGVDIGDVKLRSLRRRIGWVHQDTVLFGMTVAENIALGRPDAGADLIRAVARRVQASEFIEELPDGFDTVLGQGGFTLSGGQRQRIALAQALLRNPPILLLDEPASGLDPRARIEMKELLKTLCTMGKTILISSHILSELGEMCNKIGILEHGELLASGEVSEIMSRVREVQELRIEVFDGADRAEVILGDAPGISGLERSGDEFQMQTRLGRAELAALHGRLVREGVQLLFFEQDKGSLEDVFLSVTKGDI